MIKRCICCGAKLDNYNLSGLCYNCFCEVQKIDQVENDNRNECEQALQKSSENNDDSKLIDTDIYHKPTDIDSYKSLNLEDTEYQKLVNTDIISTETPDEFEDFELEVPSEKELKTEIPLTNDWCSNW